jgi:hypothetical protein
MQQLEERDSPPENACSKPNIHPSPNRSLPSFGTPIPMRFGILGGLDLRHAEVAQDEVHIIVYVLLWYWKRDRKDTENVGESKGAMYYAVLWGIRG